MPFVPGVGERVARAAALGEELLARGRIAFDVGTAPAEGRKAGHADDGARELELSSGKGRHSGAGLYPRAQRHRALALGSHHDRLNAAWKLRWPVLIAIPLGLGALIFSASTGVWYRLLRAEHRTCPMCGHRGPQGVRHCQHCGFDFRRQG